MKETLKKTIGLFFLILLSNAAKGYIGGTPLDPASDIIQKFTGYTVKVILEETKGNVVGKRIGTGWMWGCRKAVVTNEHMVVGNIGGTVVVKVEFLDGTSEIIPANNIHTHPNAAQAKHDIAVLKLPNNAPFKPVGRVANGSPAKNSKGYGLGFGAVVANGPLTFNQGDLTYKGVVSNPNGQYDRMHLWLPGNFIQGDSGGPMHYTGRFGQTGVFSVGMGFADFGRIRYTIGINLHTNWDWFKGKINAICGARGDVVCDPPAGLPSNYLWRSRTADIHTPLDFKSDLNPDVWDFWSFIGVTPPQPEGCLVEVEPSTDPTQLSPEEIVVDSVTIVGGHIDCTMEPNVYCNFECYDGIDNDNDGYTDYLEDFDCIDWTGSESSESSVPLSN